MHMILARILFCATFMILGSTSANVWAQTPSSPATPAADAAKPADAAPTPPPTSAKPAEPVKKKTAAEENPFGIAASCNFTNFFT